MYSKIRNFLFNGFSSDCVVCAIGPTLKFATFFGTFQGSYNCIHLNSKKSTKTEFKICKTAVIYSECLMVLLLATIMWYIYLIFTKYQNQELIIMELLADTVFCTGGVFVIFSQLSKRKNRVHELNAWVHIFRIRHKYGIHTILDVKETRRIRILGIIHCIFAVVGISFYALFVFTRPYDEQALWTSIRRPIAIIVVLVQTTIIFQFNVEGMFMYSIFRNCHKSLELQMIGHLNDSNHDSETKEFNTILLLKRNLLENKIQLTRRLHTTVNKNYLYMANVLCQLFIWWLLLLILVLILNCYIFACMWKLGQYNAYASVLVLRTTTVICMTIYFLAVVEKTSRVVSYYRNLRYQHLYISRECLLGSCKNSIVN